MNRVETAISTGRCVLVFGSRALADAEALGELRHRGAIPATVLAGAAPNPALPLGADVLAPVLTKEGGVVCLVEPDTIDAQGLNELAALVAQAPHKPRLVVAARSFNPFLLPTALRLLKFEHEKKKAKDFLQGLPVPTMAAPVAAAPVAAVEEPKKKVGGAPKVQFTGREEELAAMAGFLGAGGPIAVVGPHGVGRRWLVEKALQGGAWKRLPDFHVGWGNEADSLYARIAFFGEKNGDKRLADALRTPASRPAPAALAELALETLRIPAASDLVLVVDHLEHVLRRDGTFHREGRLELLLRALLTGAYDARVIFLTTIRPRFYREGEGANLDVLELGGLKGRELHEVFDAYRVEDFPREHFGDIVNRVHGHPFATRLFAIAMRNPDDRQELLDHKKFMVMSEVSDLEPVKRRVQKLLDGLPDEEKKALYALAHFRLPFTAGEAEEVGVGRQLRLALLGRGLLDAGLEENDRTFKVHWIVKSALPDRETSDYTLLEQLGNMYLGRAAKAEGPVKLALAQEGNRLLFEAHRIRNRMKVPFPDQDPALESLRGLVRSKKPRLDLAEQRINECLKADPANTEILLMKAELLLAKKEAPEKVAEVYAEAEKLAPTPEVFHTEASFHLLKSSGRGRAAAALERGVAAFPQSGRLRRRLAGIMVDQNRLDEAVEVLKAAMELEPMMPDTYGLLGEINLVRGPAFYDAAEEALGEARRLDPDNALHMARLGALIFARGLEDPARRQQATELLEGAIQADGKNYLAHLYLGRLLVDAQTATAADGSPATPDATVLDRADFLLKRAQKLEERAALPLVHRARIAIVKQDWANAEAMLRKATQLEPACHEAFYTTGELYAAQGHIFPALSEFQRAVERSPKDSKARPVYEDAVNKCKALIESGAAIEMARQAEAAGIAAPAERVQAERREPGKTTRRRRGRKEGGDHATQAAPDAADTTGAPDDGVEVAEVAGGDDDGAGEAVGDDDGGAVVGEAESTGDEAAEAPEAAEADAPEADAPEADGAAE